MKLRIATFNVKNLFEGDEHADVEGRAGASLRVGRRRGVTGGGVREPAGEARGRPERPTGRPARAPR